VRDLEGLERGLEGGHFGGGAAMSWADNLLNSELRWGAEGSSMDCSRRSLAAICSA